MSLILYPLPNANTFADVSIADQVFQEFFPSKALGWDALSAVEKEAGLLQSYMYMTTCNGLKIPPEYGQAGNTISSDFILAQVYLTGGRIGHSIFDVDPDARAITSETVGELSVTYDSKYKTSASDAPEMYYQLMGKYGCRKSSGFGMASLGRN